MIYIYGSYIDDSKSVLQSLSKVFGLGATESKQIIHSIGIGSLYKFKDLDSSTLYKIKELIKKKRYTGSELKKKITTDIRHYIDIRSYKGNRHLLGYPVHGQRRHTNAKTQKKLHKDRIKFVFQQKSLEK